MTQKIVINDCHGGFSLSREATVILIKDGSDYLEVHDEAQYYGPGQRHLSAETDDDGYTSYGFMGHVLVKDGKVYSAPSDGNRSHPDLVRVVEALGSEKASGGVADLLIVEIPDDVDWQIEEYDGAEWVAEQHRTWGLND